MDEEDSLFAITLDSDTEQEAKKQQEKVPRDFQSEDSFQEVLKTWKPKVENGNIHMSLLPQLPINNPSKPESQEILHAIEELYFLKRYEDSLALVRKALEGELTGEFRKVLERYRVRIERRLDSDAEDGH